LKPVDSEVPVEVAEPSVPLDSGSAGVAWDDVLLPSASRGACRPEGCMPDSDASASAALADAWAAGRGPLSVTVTVCFFDSS
jgi:hypothetical protein